MEKHNYQEYFFTWKDWIEFVLKISVKGLVICYLFFDSVKAVFLMIPLGVLGYKTMKKEKKEQQKRELTLEFKEMIQSIAASLNAGYSMEKAFADARRDMELIYEKDALIFEEMDSILSGMKMNIPLENLLKDFGDRSQNEDIENFANVMIAAKKSGGNLIRIIQKTINSISDKLSVEEEIETMITSKKFEQKIMMLMPYGIIFYLRMGNGDFLNILYHNAIGAFCMTIFLILIQVADIWAGKIMEIRV